MIVKELWVLSAQEVLPNIIVGLYLKPERITIFSTEWDVSIYMAKNQKKIFERRGINTEIVSVPTYDHRKIRERLEDIVKRRGLNPNDIVLLANVSTKYTVEVIHSWLNEKGGKSFYYLPDGTVAKFGREPVFKIGNNVVSIEDFLTLFGFEIERKNQFEEILPKKIIKRLFNFYKYLLELGIFQGKVKDKNLSSSFVNGLIEKEKNILRNFRNSFYKGKTENFLNSGIPLEFFSYEILKKSNAFNEVIANVCVKFDGKIRNEIDILALRKNTLFYFSCKKRKKFSSDEHFYRVGTLSRRLGGRYAVPVLVATGVGDEHKRKARSLGVNVVSPEELLKFLNKPSDFIKRWEKVATRSLYVENS